MSIKMLQMTNGPLDIPKSKYGHFLTCDDDVVPPGIM